MSEYISDELFHFVGRNAPTDHERNFQTLLAVIGSKCVSSMPPRIGWGPIEITLDPEGRLEDESLITGNITCYCDIPAASLARHTTKYGCFGLSFDRGRLAKYGARPVLYVPKRADDKSGLFGSAMLRNIQATFEAFSRHSYDPVCGETTQHSRPLGKVPAAGRDTLEALETLLTKDFLAYIKPYDSELPADDIDYFYSEREWRLIGGLMFEITDMTTVVLAEGYESKFRDAVPQFAGHIKSIAHG